MPTAVVVDDSPIMRRHLRALLQQAGCEVVGEGASGDDVLSLYAEHHPDVMTIDIVMPGIDGVTAATRLLRIHREATIVMCTSLTSRDKILACQRAGVRHYLLKPFEPAKVLSVVQRVLAHNRREEPRAAR